MRVVRWVLLGAVAVTLGATAGFAASLLRPRQYATFAGARGAELQGGQATSSG
jgi:hypothetical protein